MSKNALSAANYPQLGCNLLCNCNGESAYCKCPHPCQQSQGQWNQRPVCLQYDCLDLCCLYSYWIHSGVDDLLWRLALYHLRDKYSRAFSQILLYADTKCLHLGSFFKEQWSTYIIQMVIDLSWKCEWFYPGTDQQGCIQENSCTHIQWICE